MQKPLSGTSLRLGDGCDMRRWHLFAYLMRLLAACPEIAQKEKESMPTDQS